jgi:hypothetical protein
VTAVLLIITTAGMQGYHHYQAKRAGKSHAELRTRPEVTGRWIIEATEKTPKTYLNLQMSEGKLSGNTKMLFSNHPDMVISGLYARRQVAVFDGQVVGERVSFKTKRQYTRRLGEPLTMTDLVHHYDGRIDGKTMRFAVQVEGGYYEEVTAERVLDEMPAAELVATLEGHTGSVDQIVSLPDGRLASASRD